MKTCAPLLALLLVLTACPPQGPADFRKLAETAYPDNGAPNNAALDKLWVALFKLPQWYFVMSQDSAGQKQPSIEFVDGQSYLLAYTDLPMLANYARSKGGPAAPPPPTQLGANPLEFPLPPGMDAGAPAADTAKANPYVGADGKPLFVAMTPDEACAYFKKYTGLPVAGVRFNEGSARGWFGSLESVQNIRSMLKDNGKL